MPKTKDTQALDRLQDNDIGLIRKIKDIEDRAKIKTTSINSRQYNYLKLIAGWGNGQVEIEQSGTGWWIVVSNGSGYED